MEGVKQQKQCMYILYSMYTEYQVPKEAANAQDYNGQRLSVPTQWKVMYSFISTAVRTWG